MRNEKALRTMHAHIPFPQMLKDDLSAVCELIGAVHVEALANDGLGEDLRVGALV